MGKKASAEVGDEVEPTWDAVGTVLVVKWKGTRDRIPPPPRASRAGGRRGDPKGQSSNSLLQHFYPKNFLVGETKALVHFSWDAEGQGWCWVPCPGRRCRQRRAWTCCGL